MRRPLGSTEAEFIALDLLAGSEEPVGSFRLAEAFRQGEIDVAEATAGRYLQDLGRRGLTRTLGKRGRVLTEEGRRRLEHLRELRELNANSARIVEAASPGDVDELIDLLYVRRVVEPEAARLAALRATDEEIDVLASRADLHEQIATAGDERVDPALDFHRLLIQASHNEMLIAVGTIMLAPVNDRVAMKLDQVSLNPEIARITQDEAKDSARDFANDHQVLIEALRARDPARAENVMREHLDKLVHRVERYLGLQR